MSKIQILGSHAKFDISRRTHFRRQLAAEGRRKECVVMPFIVAISFSSITIRLGMNHNQTKTFSCSSFFSIYIPMHKILFLLSGAQISPNSFNLVCCFLNNIISIIQSLSTKENIQSSCLHLIINLLTSNHLLHPTPLIRTPTSVDYL